MAKISKKAEEDAPKPKKTTAKAVKPRGKKQQTVRERTKQGNRVRAKRIRTTASKVKTPLSRLRIAHKKEYHLPLPDTKLGRIGSKRIKIVPGFIRNSWNELRQVTWPNARETVRLTFAVFIFAAIFATIVGVLDFGLDKLFREVIIGK